MKLILHWIINALAVLLAAMIVPGISVASFWTALIIALILGIINITLRPILILLTLPINIVTLGLFTLVINGLMFWLAAAIVKGFSVSGFTAAFLGALIVSIIHLVVHELERLGSRTQHN